MVSNFFQKNGGIKQINKENMTFIDVFFILKCHDFKGAPELMNFSDKNTGGQWENKKHNLKRGACGNTP